MKSLQEVHEIVQARLNETEIYHKINYTHLAYQKADTRKISMIKGSFSARIKCALVLIIFMLIPIIPVTGLVGLYVLIFRPMWFKKLVDNVYANKS